MNQSPPDVLPGKIPRYLQVILPILIAIICASSYFHYQGEKSTLIRESEAYLTTIADFKVNQIKLWRRERLSDANFIFSNKEIRRQIVSFINNPSLMTSKQQTEAWMSAMFNNQHYQRMMLIDKNKRVLISLPEQSPELSEYLVEFLDSLQNIKTIRFSDFHLEPDGSPELDVFIPIIDSSSEPSHVSGIVALEIDPSMFLFPLIQSWPIPSRTSETVLFQRYGNDILFLNELRHKNYKPLTFRLPVSQPSLPAAWALKGNEGIVEGIDYRGVPVLASTKKIPNSSWYLLTKVDTEELYEPVQSKMLLMLMIVTSVILFSGLLLALVWQHQKEKLYKTLYENEVEKLALTKHFEYLTKYANDIILLTDVHLRIIEVNDRACDVYQYSREELLALTIYDLRTPAAAAMGEAHLKLIEEHHGNVYETEHKKKDGSVFPIEASTRYFFVQDKKYYQAIIRDISERKKTDRRIQKLNRVYHTLSDINQVIVRTDDRDLLFMEVCKIITHVGNFHSAWIGVVDKATNSIQQVFSDGINNDQIATLLPHSPDGSVDEHILQEIFSTGKSVIYNNIISEWNIEPWYSHAISSGYTSLAMIPLSLQDRIIGVLTVCASEKDSFDAEEMQLLDEIGLDISFAIKRIETEQQRKRTEETLRISEERYRGLFENMAEGYALCKTILENGEPKDWVYLAVNDAFERLTGLKNVVNKKASEVIPGILESDMELVRRYARVALTGNPENFEFYVEALKMWFSISVYSPEKEYFVAVFDVITERKRSEAVLRASEEKFKELFDDAPVGYHELDKNGVIINVNRTELMMLGYTLEEMLGRPIWEFVMDTERAKERVINKLTHNTSKDINVERMFKRKNGTILNVLSDEKLLYDAQGSVKGMRTVIQDITEHKKTESELLRLRKAVETSGEIIFITDKDGTFLYTNPAFTTLYGYRYDEVVGKASPKILKSGKQKAEEYQKFWNVLLNKNSYKWEIINKTKEGLCLNIEASASPILDDQGEIVGFLAIQRDVTEKKQLEEQYYRAQRLESLGTLAGGIAHDLNNVLTPILLAAELLKNQYRDPRSQSIIETLERSASRGKGIVHQILTFARGSQGERGIIQLKHIIREMEKIVQETFPRSIQCKTHIERDLLPISGDATQMHQVLMNLCVNARDSMPEGGLITITAENRNLDTLFLHGQHDIVPGMYIAITVKDTGVGMPQELLGKIFEPFFTTKEHGKGTGLGLATVHSIIKSHGGFITVQSEVGIGSSFIINIPAIQDAQFSLNELKDKQIPAGLGEHILIVDDEASIRDITKQTLELYGYNVSQASDGTEAIALYVRNMKNIHVVITDIMMPIMDGYATIRALKKINPDIIIIATSGLIADHEIIETTVGKIDAFLQKPFTPLSLLETLSELLAKQKKG